MTSHDAFAEEIVTAGDLYSALRRLHPERVNDLRLNELMFELVMRDWYQVYLDCQTVDRSTWPSREE